MSDLQLEPQEHEIEIGRRIARACIGYQMGVSDATAKKYVPDDAPVGDLWITLARIWWESQKTPVTTES